VTVNMIITLKKKPDLTVEQFHHHYETSHWPLAKKYGGHLFQDYRRYYVFDVHRLDRSPIGEDRKYDAVAVFKFKHQLDCDTWLHMMETPEIGKLFQEDNEKFLDLSEGYAYFANEVRTWVANDLRPSSAQCERPLTACMIATLKARPDLTPMQFRYHYETSHVTLARKNGGHLIEDYRRYYPYVAFRLDGGAVSPERAYDDITIMKFQDDAARKEWYRVDGEDPNVVEDEFRFLDRSQVFAYAATEVKSWSAAELAR